MAELNFCLEPGATLRGHLRVPGDKSISHRAVMLGSLARGTTTINGFLQGDDCLATLRAFQAMGVIIRGPRDGRVVIEGVGLRGLRPLSGPLYLGNSGTSMRLLAGILAGQTFTAVLSGDDSLNRRPMYRIIEPLERMGARIQASGSGTAPLTIVGRAGTLVGIDYVMPVASAQVKSCVLLAGLFADGRTCVTQPAPTRDHTERMLAAFGCPVTYRDGAICLFGESPLRACPVDVPGDISSAAFLMVGASIGEDSEVVLEHVGVNPTRTGIIEILKRMGADIELFNPSQSGGEPVADIRVRSARLRGVHIPQSLVPLAIDEFPAIFVAAACAEGDTTLTGAGELRVKESDRIQVMAQGLKALGVAAESTPDGMRIRGRSTLTGGRIDSHGDHRVAMAFAMASLRADGEIHIRDCNNINTSFPGFLGHTRSLGLAISEYLSENGDD